MDPERKRWTGTIDDGLLTVNRTPYVPVKLDVSAYFNIHQLGDSPLPKLVQITERLPMGLGPDGETLFTRSNSSEGWLYVVSNPKWPEWMKIGITRDLSKRLSSYNTGAPITSVYYRYEYYRYDDNARIIEQKIHSEMTDSQDKGDSSEWYKITKKIAKEIIDTNCDNQ